MKEKDFTGNRKQSFAGTLLLMINFLTKSLSLEIENFVHYLRREITSAKPFTKSAFVQARKKIALAGASVSLVPVYNIRPTAIAVGLML